MKASVTSLSQSTGVLTTELKMLQGYNIKMRDTIEMLEKDNQVLRSTIEQVMTKLIK